jgi:biotin transport system substrate-specific component
MAVCAHVSLPLVFSPVPLTLQTFGVLLIGFALGSKRGFAALALYLMEGASGLPVFSPTGPGGIAQIAGPTGGFLMAYPWVAFLAGWIFEQRDWQKIGVSTFGAAACAAVAAETLLFSSGMLWLKVTTSVSLAKATMMAVAPFIPGEVLKIAASSAIASRLRWKNPRDRQELTEI